MHNLETNHSLEPDYFFKTKNDSIKKNKRQKIIQTVLLFVTAASILQISSLYWAQSSLHSFQVERQDNFYRLTENENSGLLSFKNNMIKQDFKAAQYDMYNILTSYEQVGSLLGTSYIDNMVRTGKFEYYDENKKQRHIVNLTPEVLSELSELGIRYGRHGFNSYKEKINNYQPCFSYDSLCQYAYSQSITHVQKHINNTAQKLDDNMLSILLNTANKGL